MKLENINLKLMGERIINADKEADITSLVENELVNFKDEDIKSLESKIGDFVSKAYPGETWMCKVELQSNKLPWHKKPQTYHINRRLLEVKKRLLDEQARGYEKMMIATSDYRIFLIKSKLEVTHSLTVLSQINSFTDR